MNNNLDLLISGKRILVTGGTGSIGSTLVKKLLKHHPKQIRIFSRDEHKQFVLAQKLKNPEVLRWQIGDIRDQARVHKAMNEIDIVFHTAALKHVPACEYNPFEAVQTNVIGTENIINSALQNNVERLISISTDKAVAPLNVMGATKLLAEKLVTSTIYHRGNRPLISSVVRFGNVIGSRGSVLPIFKSQYDSNQPITVTHENMTRFFLSIHEATNLVLKAATSMQGAEIFVLKMPAIRIADLAKALVEILNKTHKKDKSQKQIIFTEPRPGEKLDEIMMTEEEAQLAVENDDMFILRPYLQFPELCNLKNQYTDCKSASSQAYASSQSAPLQYNNVLELVKEYLEIEA